MHETCQLWSHFDIPSGKIIDTSSIVFLFSKQTSGWSLLPSL